MTWSKTIEVYSENKMKRKKAHELRLERVRFRARNKCLSALLDKIEEGYSLEALKQYCYGQQSINSEKIDRVKEVLKDMHQYNSYDLRDEKKLLEKENEYPT